jgi:putative transposase
LTTQKAFFARLNYVMQNPVRHGLVAVATHYRWCSATWFLANTSPAHFKTVTSFPVGLQQGFDSFIPRLPAKATSKSQSDI